LGALSRSTLCQAWTSPAGSGSVTPLFQWIDNTGHRLSNGTRLANGQSVDASIYLEGEYAFTDRLSISLGVPYVYSKFTSEDQPPPFLPFFPRDQCRCWHDALQDFGFAARYKAIGDQGGSFALTPSISVGVPSHAYEYRGEAVAGRRLRELRLALFAAQRLDFLSPRLAVEGRYTYAFVEKVLDIPNDRSNAELEVAYQVSRGFQSRVFVAEQWTHGGLRAGDFPPYPLFPPGEVNTPERVAEHDRLLKDQWVHVGVGVSYQFSRFDLFASYVEFVSGTDTHSGRSYTVGISYPFDLK